MNKHVIARRRHVAERLKRWAKRIRKIQIPIDPRKFKVQRPEDAALAERIQSIANMVEREARNIRRVKST